MRDFFEDLRTIDKIQSLIDGCERESEVLEYKRASVSFDERAKKEIAKDVSAMANSSGGVIVFGVGTDEDDKTKPTSIEGLSIKNIETFDRVINSRIQPPIRGLRKKVLPEGAPQAMVVYIPASEERPHQNVSDKKYYRRSGVESIPMEHDLVALQFGRRLGPFLSLKFQPLTRPSGFSGDPAFSNESLIRVLVENTGKRIGRFVEVILLFPDEQHIKNIRLISGKATNIDRLHPRRQARQFTENIGVFHPVVSKSILELGLVISQQLIAESQDEPFIEWTIFSDNMNPREGFITLRQLGWATMGG